MFIAYLDVVLMIWDCFILVEDMQVPIGIWEINLTGCFDRVLETIVLFYGSFTGSYSFKEIN